MIIDPHTNEKPKRKHSMRDIPVMQILIPHGSIANRYHPFHCHEYGDRFQRQECERLQREGFRGTTYTWHELADDDPRKDDLQDRMPLFWQAMVDERADGPMNSNGRKAA